MGDDTHSAGGAGGGVGDFVAAGVDVYSGNDAVVRAENHFGICVQHFFNIRT